ncbi:MAG: DUF3137 domain-containing protein [Eubacterium sp.]|nr:DUF3137 domain-containing protein [Eubacterium sp.]
MELSAFRKRLINGELDQSRIALLKSELDYFSSIAPRSLLDRIKSNTKFANMEQGTKALFIILGLMMIPIALAAFSLFAPLVIIAFVAYTAITRGKQNPEFKSYNFIDRIATPTLKIFDDKLEARFHYDALDLVDTDMHYQDALVEAHMIKPVKSKCYGTTFSTCSYDWAERPTTDSFEFAGYKVSYEWTDSDGDKHEEIYFNGVIFKFRTSFTTNGIVNIMSTNSSKGLLGGEKEKNIFKPIKDRELRVIDTENHEFAENFDTIATFDDEAYRFLTPTMIETLLNLRKKYFFSICIKGNVMTVTIDKSGYKDATMDALKQSRPFFGFKDTEAEANNRICNCGKFLMSVYELKDILDPGGIYAG